MLVAAGVAPDLDYASYLGGASSFLRFGRTLLHSLVSSFALAIIIAATFYLFAANRDRHFAQADDPKISKLSFSAAFVVCAIGIAGHLLLDLASGVGVQLLWPFQIRWFSFDLLREFDIWILVFLAAGLLLPMLIGLVSEEIGERKEKRGLRRGAIAALAMIVAYMGARAILHSRAVDLLQCHDYHGRTALAAGAFPNSTSPLEWRGVISTENTIEEIDVPFAPGHEFDPEHSVTLYKPEDSPALQAGQSAEVTQQFLRYARFPIASVVRVGDEYQFELRDARFAASDASPANIFVRIEIGGNMRILSQELLFTSRR